MMKRYPCRLSLFIPLSLLTMLVLIYSGCSYITGQALDKTTAPAARLPRWLWSASNGPYSIIVDRYTHQPIRDVNPHEAFGIMGTSSRLDNPAIIDVRTPLEYNEGHIHYAVNIDYRSPSFRDDISKLDKDRLYIVYCRTGARSSAARNTMEELGFKHVINMTGGFSAWKAAGLPVFP